MSYENPTYPDPSKPDPRPMPVEPLEWTVARINAEMEMFLEAGLEVRRCLLHNQRAVAVVMPSAGGMTIGWVCGPDCPNGAGEVFIEK